METIVVLKLSDNLNRMAGKIVQCHNIDHCYFLLTSEGILELSYLCLSILQELFTYVSTFPFDPEPKIATNFLCVAGLCIYRLALLHSKPAEL